MGSVASNVVNLDQARARENSPRSPDELVQRFGRWWAKADAEVKREIRKIVRADGEAWRSHWDEGLEVLALLNRRRKEIDDGKRGYRATPANMRFICQRLHEGASVGECKAVVAVKARQCKAGDFSFMYLRPETLFNATKFESYLGELGGGQ